MTLEKILKVIILSGLFATPFLVLSVANGMFFPYIVGKNFGFRIIVEVIFVAWALLALISNEARPRRSPIFISATVFIAIVALADMFGANPFKSFWSNYERMEGLVTLLHLLAYSVVWGTMLSSKKLRIWFWRVTIAVSVLVSFHALAEYFSSDSVRLASTLGNPIYLAVYVLFHIFVAAIFALRRNASFSERVVLGSIIVLELVVLYLTATRGATLGLIGGMLLAAVGIALTEKNNWQLKKLSAGVVFAVLVVVGGFVALRNTDFVQNSHVLNRFAHISLSEGTVMARTYVWGMAIDGIKERPLLGWGQENFNFVFNKYYDPRMYAQEQWFDRTHNIVFDWLIAAGILGLLAYISIFLTLLWTLYKTSGFNVEQKWLMVGLLGAYSFHNLTVFDNIISYILFFSIIAWVYATSQEDESMPASQAGLELKLGTPSTKLVAVAVAGALATGLIWFVNVDAYRANKTLLSALTDIAYARALANADRAEDAVARAREALTKFKEAGSYDSFGIQEVREHFTQNADTVLRAKWAPQELKQKYFIASAEALKAQKLVAPNDARFPLFLANLYESAGLLEAAQGELARARELSPTKQSIILKQGINALSQEQNEEALAYFKLAYELDKTYPQAISFYLKVLTQTGGEAEAQKIRDNLKRNITQ